MTAAVAFLVVAVVILVLVLSLRAPRSDRDWAADHAEQARVAFEDGAVRIDRLRDFRHRPGGTFSEAYRDVRYELDEVRGVWFVLAPFAKRWRGLAHSFVSFELTGGRFVAVSVEARRESDEGYSIVGGMLRGLEVTYVVGTEEDVIGLRAVRGDTLFLYPSRATPEQARTLFVDMLSRAESLRTEPEFYNTLLNNCNTILRNHVNHVNRVASEPLPFGWGVLLPGYSDALALRHGLLDTEFSIDEARRHFRIEQRAAAALRDGRPFSTAIREGL